MPLALPRSVFDSKWLAWTGRRPLVGYGVALLCLCAALANVALLQTPAPLASCLLAVIVSTWFGGTRPGMLTAGLAAPSLLYIFVQQAGVAGSAHLSRIPYFLLISAFIIWVIASERRALDALRRNENDLRLVVDTMPTMAWIVLPDGRLDFINRPWLEYAGVSLEQAIANSTDTMHADDIPRVFEKWREAMASGKAFEDEMRLRRADGVYRWFLVRTVPLLGDNGQVVRWYGTSTDIEDRRRAEARLQQLSHRLLEVQESERRHLARELHDEFGQILAAIHLRLHAAKQADGPAAQANLDKCAELLEQASARVHDLAIELRPPMLESAGLNATLHWLAEQQLRQNGVAAVITGGVREVSGEMATVCFRVAQEAFTNILRHAKARNVTVELAQTATAVGLVVRDDGAGFDSEAVFAPAATADRLGLLGMRERVQTLGGSLHVHSRPGAGTRIHVSLPTQERQPIIEEST